MGVLPDLESLRAQVEGRSVVGTALERRPASGCLPWVAEGRRALVRLGVGPCPAGGPSSRGSVIPGRYVQDDFETSHRSPNIPGDGRAAGVGSAAWVGISSSWSARFLRERLAEFGKDIPPAPHKPSPRGGPTTAITLAWLGHATVLVNFYGVWMITDPVLFPRIGVGVGVGIGRTPAARAVRVDAERTAARSISCWCRTRISIISIRRRWPRYRAGRRR